MNPRTCLAPSLAFLALVLVATLAADPLRAADADLILHNGKVVTVDKAFSIRSALAVKGQRLVAVGSDDEVMKLRGPKTQVIDLKGKTVIPGLIDSHVHAPSAAMTEFDHPIPTMETIGDVLDYIRGRAKKLSKGQWIVVRQVFITRLREQRYPTRAELDEAAPDNPVMFSTGPDASLNTLALKLSKIDKDFKITDGGPGYIEKDPKTGEPTGILRSCTRYVKTEPTGRRATEADRTARLAELFHDYNSVGLTTVSDRNASPSAIDRYARLLQADKLTVRMAAMHSLGTIGDIDNIKKRIKTIAAHPLRKPNPMLRVIGIKTFLDGGMLTGSAYMRKPWGVSKIYSIDDPKYRGLLFIPKEKLKEIVRATAAEGLQFTAHSVGDGAVHTLIGVYEELAKEMPIAKTRPCVTHCNFMSKEAIETMARVGIVADLQPAWLYLDARTLSAQFGNDRLRYFQPLKSLFAAGVVIGGGSDHMQKIGSLRSVNPYNPFLGMWTTITRRARWYEGRLHPEEALTREQALRFYTINNAYLLFLEKETGSLEPDKLADLAVLDTDILTCPVDKIRETTVLRTYLGGKLVYKKGG
jgi:predicted amidohydrolase YtcJ